MKKNAALLLAVAGLFAAGTMFVVPQVQAQKKSKSKVATQQQPAKEEGQDETAATPAIAPQPQPSVSISGGLVDIMKKYLGQKTNLGTLKKVNKEYVEFEDENVILTVPLTNVHSVKQVTEKDDNDSAVVKLEIRLTSKD